MTYEEPRILFLHYWGMGNAESLARSLKKTLDVQTLRAAHTDTHVYLLVQWTDATKSDAGHKTWDWDDAKNAYAEDTDTGDMDKASGIIELRFAR